MSDYTPTTKQVREQFTREEPPQISTVTEKGRAFDRWLEQVKAETRADVFAQPFPTGAEIAEEPTGLPIGFDRWLEQVKAEAWEEGHNAGQHNEHEYRQGRAITNPYRQETN